MNPGNMKDQLKMVQEIKKAQKELKKELIEVEAGDGAVIVRVSGELKIVSVKINPDMIDLNDIAELENWIKIAVRDGLAEAQKIAAEKMKPFMSGLGNLGL